ncbi:hypothetical protein K7432_013313 [Basidiobolus ranarum]|uniref:Uncharacterized protein n=1 Tax=Basidiobolus ranarum TaxID=34480 RepID=A0ABR2VQZ5_9FUNG
MHLLSVAFTSTLLWSVSIAKPLRYDRSPSNQVLAAESVRQALWNKAQDGRIDSLESDIGRIDDNLINLKAISSQVKPNPYPGPGISDGKDDIEMINPFQKVKLAAAMKNLGQVLHFLGQSVTLARETITLSGAMASQVNANTDGLDTMVPNIDHRLAGLERELEKKFPGITRPFIVAAAPPSGRKFFDEKQLIDPSQRKINKIHIKLLGNNPTHTYVSKRVVTTVRLRPKMGMRHRSSFAQPQFSQFN